jgi:hypothetical protein
VGTIVLAIVAFTIAVLGSTAQAESCSRSRDYILNNSASDLPQKAQTYQNLFKTCLDTLQMPNVKDAFVLKAGAIAVIPKDDSVTATANTLAQFCGRFRRGMLRFVARRELPEATNIARAIGMSTGQATSCQKINGDG